MEVVEHCSNPDCKKKIGKDEGRYRFNSSQVFCEACGEKRLKIGYIPKGYSI